MRNFRDEKSREREREKKILEDFVLKAFVINFMDEDKLEVLFFVIAMNAFLKKSFKNGRSITSIFLRILMRIL